MYSVTKVISVSVLEYQPLFMSGVSHELRADRSVKIVFQGTDPGLALKFAGSQPHDVMLIGVEKAAGLDVVQAIAGIAPKLAIIVLSVSEDEAIVSQALANGARGYLLRDIARTELINAIQVVRGGAQYLAPRLGARLLAMANARGKDPDRRADLNRLTSREDEILAKVTEGWTNREIGNALDISEKTVKYYMTNIMQKLQVRNRVEAAIIVRNQKMRA